MRIEVPLAVCSAERIERGMEFELANGNDKTLIIPDSIAYPPLINCHDHLVGNWWPRAGKNRPYINSHLWVEDMRHDEPFYERQMVWSGESGFDLVDPLAVYPIGLGVYKNLFSGVDLVQDHVPNQVPEYYRRWPIRILREYRQCHSLTLGNWWGGRSAREEWLSTQERIPFIIHVGEGLDEITRNEFNLLTEMGLDRPNTLLVHGVAFNREEIRHCAGNSMSICWCPTSNLYLIGRTLDAAACLEEDVNIVLGTDSAMSGSFSLFDEMRTAREVVSDIPASTLFRMVTTNASRALMLADDRVLSGNSDEDVLILDARCADPYENLLMADASAIRLFVFHGRPLLGDVSLFNRADIDPADYCFFHSGGVDRFVAGHPDRILATIRERVGYLKMFPFLPF